ncbi:TPA: hypothetical protein QDZ12_006038 [Pseudomonas putida]|uniref:hypothetical protein n=1 Tax=Pseudomonas sp. HD6515 TaxID=2856556 RepID=UPI00217D3F3A|nr:hypothetical protein [Pseudomonas sp. HD6515]ELS0924333.1 hypothetical protein [Pseudomonas putida]UWH21902.1 hypothetical protein KW568_23440 [Pseudomonas sp. HD6515]HDS0942669.1 hypothetical protein [Pseudomonas putida]
MNIELSKLVKDEQGTFALAKIHFMYDETVATPDGIQIPEENLYVDFGYKRINGVLEVLHFNVYDASDDFYKHFNNSALQRLQRGVIGLCEAAGAANLYI